jgi:hypothetical protein
VLWGADDATAALRYPDDGRQGHFDEPAPEVGGLRFVMVLVLPDSDPQAQEDAAAAGDAHTEMKGLHIVPGSDSPIIHFTATVDLAVVVDGEVIVEMDDGSRSTYARATLSCNRGRGTAGGTLARRPRGSLWPSSACRTPGLAHRLTDLSAPVHRLATGRARRVTVRC